MTRPPPLLSSPIICSLSSVLDLFDTDGKGAHRRGGQEKRSGAEFLSLQILACVYAKTAPCVSFKDKSPVVAWIPLTLMHRVFYA